jgi:hypothetical protein
MENAGFAIAAVVFGVSMFCWTMLAVFDEGMDPIEIVATCAVDGKLYFERDDVTVTCEVVRK